MAAPTANCNADAAAAVTAGSKRALPGAAADSDRRVQPRHFHAGPNPAAASAADDDSAASEESAHPPSAAARLYRHALESIFAFLSQHELVTALQVSHSWLAAAESMSSLQLHVKEPSAPLRVVAESVMGRHIIQLGADEDYVTMTAESLAIVARLMPQLRELHCELELTPSGGPLSLPSGLRVLHLSLLRRPAAANVIAALEAISRLPLLHTFAICLDELDDQLSFAPLARLPLLRDLSLDELGNDEEENEDEESVKLSDEQVAQLRALPLLRRLDVWPMTTTLMGRLLAQPHDLQWQETTLPDPLDDEAVALLPQLPSLTALQPRFDVTCERFDFLRRLPNLIHVNLYIGGPISAGRIDSLVGGLQCCTMIEELTLISTEITAAHLAELLPRLPRLHTLALFMAAIDSLSFLAQEPMTQQLSNLTLSHCPLLPLMELRRVHALRALKCLFLVQSFDAPMDALSLSLHTPPSPLIPQLVKFMYEKPTEPSDESE